ncbi:flagellar protein FlgN [Virgibacillus dokdonensis]|uniref:Flagellar protein FlgN n=1 Tax=Virgibacillus dokdonensis TaxID=302167 RepID=A0A2K9IU11_9BACI|nr:flagellar protein FlgN [Virgibacillus dokdonensis]AUJ23288.1 FlgN protein [Virgibacillus dokdonensis]
MSLKTLIDILEKLLHLHVEFVDLSKMKTNVVKNGDVDTLSSIIARERKLSRKMEKVEKERQQYMATWFEVNQPQEQEQTVTTLLSQVESEKDKEQLIELTTELMRTMAQLKQQEQLNRMLIQQSLQFVHFSLDLMNPTIESMNYGTDKEKQVRSKQSLFDSKV